MSKFSQNQCVEKLARQMEVKIKTFKILAQAIFYKIPHFKCVKETAKSGRSLMQVYRLATIFDDPQHLCIARCRAMLQEHLIMIHEVLSDIEDYAMFLVVFDKFFQDSLQVREDHIMREQILQEFYSVEYFNRQYLKNPKWFNLGLPIRLDADSVKAGPWYKKVECIYLEKVGSFTSKLPCVTFGEKKCFLQEARDAICEFAKGLPDDKVFRFLCEFM